MVHTCGVNWVVGQFAKSASDTEPSAVAPAAVVDFGCQPRHRMDQLSLASGATALASVINRLLDSKLTHRRKLLEAYAREQGIGFFEELIAEEVTEQGDGVWELAAPESNLAKYVAALALQLFQSTALQSPHSLKAI